MEREGGGRGNGAEKEQLSLVEGKWRKLSMGWGVDWGGHLLRGSDPKVGKMPLHQAFLSLSWHHRVCPPATLEPSWPRTSRTEGAGEVGCAIPFSPSLESSSHQSSQSHSFHHWHLSKWVLLYQKEEEVSGERLSCSRKISRE